MPSKTPLIKSSSRSSRSKKSGQSRSRSSTKFIPNLVQLNEAIKELPDPEIWPEKTYQYPLEVDGKQCSIEFSLISINRGKEQATRWIYEGKILIRKRDS